VKKPAKGFAGCLDLGFAQSEEFCLWQNVKSLNTPKAFFTLNFYYVANFEQRESEQ